MFSEKISKEYIVKQQGTSEGTQIKYKWMRRIGGVLSFKFFKIH